MAPITTMRQVYLLVVLRAPRRQRAREGPARARASSASSRASTSCCSAAGASSTRARSSSSAACSLMIVVVPAVAHRDVPQGRRCASSTSTCSRTSSTAPPVGVDNSPGTFEYYTVAASATACGCGPRSCRPRSPPRSCARAPTRARAACASWSRCGRSPRSRSSASSRPSSTTTSSRRSRRSAILVAFFLDDILAQPRAPASALRRARHRHRAARSRAT